ncbi:hypothetical protein GQ457_02G042920 [Hibiscus cannabinus]
MEALRNLKTDGTFNQSAPLDRLVGVKKIYYIDLKATTDRWPLMIHLDLLKSLFMHEFADEVGNLAQWINSFLKFAHHGTNTRFPLKDEEEIFEVAVAAEEHDDGNSWFYDIKNYLKDRSFPSYATSKDKEIIRRITTRYA